MAEWDQQPGESDKAHRAFVDYCLLGLGRSLRKLLESYRGQSEGKAGAEIPPTQRQATLEQWSSKHDWQTRVKAWDAEQERLDRELWKQRRAQVQAQDWELGETLRQLVVKTLETDAQRFVKDQRYFVKGRDGLPDREVVIVSINAAALIKAAEAASKLQRLATGMPDSHNEVTVNTPTLTAQDLAAIRDEMDEWERERFGTDDASGSDTGG